MWTLRGYEPKFAGPIRRRRPPAPLGGAYRLCVRASRTRLLLQIIRRVGGQDATLCQAASAELRQYGVALGHTSVPAAYLSGVLVARRFLAAHGLARAPFALSVDTGARAPAGLRMRAAVSGAAVGGLFALAEPIPPALMEAFEGRLAADYMRLLAGSPERYARQFARFARLGIDCDMLVPIYRRAFAAIAAAFP